MNRNLLILGLALMLAALAPMALAQEADPVTAPSGGGSDPCRFIDEDGDGFNDLAPDDDGDGIPNGLDPDYKGSEAETGYKFTWGLLSEMFGFGFGRDAEGIGNRHMYGPGDGASGTGPADGTGFGPGTGGDPGDGDGHNGSNGSSGQDGQSSRRGGHG